MLFSRHGRVFATKLVQTCDCTNLWFGWKARNAWLDTPKHLSRSSFFFDFVSICLIPGEIGKNLPKVLEHFSARLDEISRFEDLCFKSLSFGRKTRNSTNLRLWILILNVVCFRDIKIPKSNSGLPGLIPLGSRVVFHRAYWYLIIEFPDFVSNLTSFSSDLGLESTSFS